MNEESVTRSVMEWLDGQGWEVLDYDFPGGGTGRKFRQESDCSAKNKGIVIPDIVAIKDDTCVLFEDKESDTADDYRKVVGLVRSTSLPEQMARAYPEHSINTVLAGIAYAGESHYLALAEKEGVDVVVQVDPQSGKCQIVYGTLTPK